ncbi:hypothetical protein HMSSN036_62000 [Paenibacillus macerans]|nr:hypothetical protein HMSSN036_62000 [Paenibacillus macerans]
MDGTDDLWHFNVVPVFWLVISAFKTNADFYARPFGLPEVWRGDNFLRAWESSRLGAPSAIR